MKEDVPHWDADKQRLFDDAALRSVGMDPSRDGARSPTNGGGWSPTTARSSATAGSTASGGTRRSRSSSIPAHRGEGIGAFVLDRLEDEAHKRGLNYIYNVVPDTHPDRAWMTGWLEQHGLHESSQGDLRRQVGALR